MIRNDVVRMYREIHSWVGIVCGLFLFIAFYAGAISMFEMPLQRWASPPLSAQAHTITPLDKTQELIDKVCAAHPMAAKNFNIILQPGPEQPARLHWQQRPAGADDHAPAINFYADLDEQGELTVQQEIASTVPQLIDTLHQQVGLLIEHELAMPITGAVSLLYGLALVSGVIILLPTLVKDLFALRLGKKVKRMWLDVHNLLGVFSLPFHIIMALTAVVFALHDHFYGSQMISIYPDKKVAMAGPPTATAPSPGAKFYPIRPMMEKLAHSEPDFKPEILNYRKGRGPNAGQMLLVAGSNPRHHASRPRHGLISLNAYTGEIIGTDYTPGKQQPLQATVSSFFALHFGNFGGNTTRWLYFILGLGGAFLFYSGNLLWLEVRRKKSRDSSVVQSRSNRLLGSLTVGASLGCIAAISTIIAASKWLPNYMAQIPGNYTLLYYLVFISALLWAFYQGAAKSAVQLLWGCAACTALIPLASILAALTHLGWNHGDSTVWVDIIATIAVAGFVFIAQKTQARISQTDNASIWTRAEA